MANIFGDLKNNLIFGVDRYPAAATASANGSGVDMQDHIGATLTALLFVGTVSGTSPTLDSKVQESSDNSTFTDVSGATFTQVTASNSSQQVLFKPTKRYVRVAHTIAGTSPSFTVGAMFLGQYRHTPTNDGGWDNVSAAT